MFCLGDSRFVIPAKAGIQLPPEIGMQEADALDSGLRRNDWVEGGRVDERAI